MEETGLYPGGTFAGDPCKATFTALQSQFKSTPISCIDLKLISVATWRDGINPVGSVSTEAVGISYIANFPGLNNTSTVHGPFVTLVSTTDAK